MQGYHGHTGFALSAGDPVFRRHFEPLMPGFAQVPFGDAGAMAEAVDSGVAAVILETIPATAGMLIPPPEYLPEVRRICDRSGALLILDEVQAGLGRTGRLWAFEEWGILPDMLVLGKGLSGGVYPMSAVVYRRHLDRFFQENPFVHLSSFGGADLGCVAALAMLEETTRPGFLEHVRQMGELLERGFERLRERHPGLVSGWRRRGLLAALELAEDRMGPMMTQALGLEGVLALFADFRPRAMQVLPPLIIQADQVDELLGAWDRALDRVREMVSSGAPTPYIP
jgi:acetylornithine/succinyldiaminopimelate/putrescine aminotransferase